MTDPQLIIDDAVATAAAGERAAVPRLLASLESNRLRPDGFGPVVRFAIVEALRTLGDPTTLPALCAELGRSISEEDRFLLLVTETLGELGDARALPALRARLIELDAAKPTDAVAIFPWQQQTDAVRAAIAHCTH